MGVIYPPERSTQALQNAYSAPWLPDFYEMLESVVGPKGFDADDQS
jgi:hypothetical protein